MVDGSKHGPEQHHQKNGGEHRAGGRAGETDPQRGNFGGDEQQNGQRRVRPRLTVACVYVHSCARYYRQNGKSLVSPGRICTGKRDTLTKKNFFFGRKRKNVLSCHDRDQRSRSRQGFLRQAAGHARRAAGNRRPPSHLLSHQNRDFCRLEADRRQAGDACERRDHWIHGRVRARSTDLACDRDRERRHDMRGSAGHSRHGRPENVHRLSARPGRQQALCAIYRLPKA